MKEWRQSKYDEDVRYPGCPNFSYGDFSNKKYDPTIEETSALMIVAKAGILVEQYLDSQGTCIARHFWPKDAGPNAMDECFKRAKKWAEDETGVELIRKVLKDRENNVGS